MKYFDESLLDFGFNKIETANKQLDTYNSFWEGEPNQEYKIFNSTDEGATIYAVLLIIPTLFIIAYCTSYLLASFYQSKHAFDVFLISLFSIQLIPFVYIDIREFIFRKGNKYWINHNGIIFRRGYLEKNDYLLPWDSIESISTSQPRKSIYFETRINAKQKLVSANDISKMPFIEVNSIDEYYELVEMIKPYVERRYQAT